MTNATALEIAYTLCMATAFLIALVSLSIVAWKYSIYRRPDKDGHRPNGVTVWLFARDALLYIMLCILTVSETMFGLFSMTVPSSDAQENDPILGFLTISMAVIILALAVCNLVIGVVAFRRISKG